MMAENERGRRSSESTDDEYKPTDDQRQAMMELDSQKAEMVYPDEEPPEYDVTDRLKQLNAELKEEEDPGENRETRVGFKEDPVSMVVPPPTFSDDEESNGKESARGFNADSDRNNRYDPDKSERKQEKSRKNSDDSEEIPETWDDSDSEQRHLVERDGKFEYISNEEYMAQEYKNEEKNRPHSANESDSKRKEDDSYGIPRAQSAANSKYAMTPEQRQEMAKRRKERQKRQEEEERRRKEEEEERRKENDEAFRAWLERKRDQHREDAKREKERNSQKEDEERDPEKAYKEWCLVKTKRQQEEKDMEEKRQKEQMEGFFVRSRKDCDKAFKEWVKKKNAEKKQQKNQQKARLFALSASRSRKSQALARAIQYSQAFRYVDYYGYRM